MLVIDTANVIGSRPTGWWRDRPGATRRFTERVRATVTAGRLARPVTLVLEGRARAGVDEGEVDGVEVVHAPGEGDDTIAAIAAANRAVVVVTADRELAERIEGPTPGSSGRAGCSTGSSTDLRTIGDRGRTRTHHGRGGSAASLARMLMAARHPGPQSPGLCGVEERR